MKTKNIFLTLALVLIASYSFAQGVITGSAHDFKAAGWNTAGLGQICITCHAPHKAKGTALALGAPLWNRQASASTYTPYSAATSVTFQATSGAPAGASKLCLSCHDGTIDLASFGAATGTAGTKVLAVNNLGVDLTTHHPISFTYDAALVTADGGLKAPGDAGVAPLLFSGKVECSSCHDVHNNGTGTTKLLVKNNTAGSALCLTCHAK